MGLCACASAPEAQPVPPGEILGDRHSEVRALIEGRQASGYKAGSGSDGKKLCLVVQGGGMRGIVGSASAVALDQLGIAGTFDAMYGTSAGALTVAYLAAGQIAFGTSIYYQNLAGHTHFINRWRLSEPMDIGFLFDQWITRGKALDAAAVEASPARIVVSATDTADGATRMFDNRELTPADFVSAVRASTSMPLFSDNVETIGGRGYVDGFVGAPVPVEAAVQDGCTHMLVVPTSTPETRDAIGFVERVYALFRMGRFPPAFREAFASRASVYNATVDRLYGRGYGIPTMIVAPRDPGVVPESSETDPELLIAAGEAALRRMERAFDAPAGSTRLYFAPEGMQAFPGRPSGEGEG